MNDYGFEHNGRVFTPNGTVDISPAANDARNRAIEAAELAHWQTKPDRMLAYYRFIGHEQRPNKQYRENFYPSLTGASVSTWANVRLGTIISARVYRHNFGSRMVSIRVRGSNGAIYYGRASWDWGTCITLRKVKS